MSSEQLELHLLGVPRVNLGGQTLKLTRKGLALLAYVTLEGITPREKIADLLWGELGADGASRNLRRELHRLRETPITGFLESEGAIGLREFNADTSNPSATGELLEGLILTDAPEFMTWLNQQRQTRHQHLVQHLRLAAINNPALEQRLQIQQQVNQLEPMSEPDAKATMQTLMELGRTSEAEQIYVQLRIQLQELGTQPELRTAEVLLANSSSPEHKTKLFERIGRNADTLEYRLQAANQAKTNNQPQMALTHYAAALEYSKKPLERLNLHKERLQLLIATAQFDQLENELQALLQSVQGNAQLEPQALVIKSGVQFQRLEFAGSLENALLALENPLLPKTDQAAAYLYAGSSSIRLGQLKEAKLLLESALERLEKNQFKELAQANHVLSQLAMQSGNTDKAINYNQAAAEALNHTEDRVMRSTVLNVSGVLAMQQNQYPKALRLLEIAKRECSQSQNVAAMPMILINTAKAHIELGELDQAIETLEEALVLVRTSNNRIMEGQLLNNLAVTHQERGDLGAALETYTAALEFAITTKDARGIAFRHMSLADLLMQIGDYTESQQHLEDAAQHIKNNLPDLQPWWDIQQAEWFIYQDQHAQALALLEPLMQHTDTEIRLNATYFTARSLAQRHQDPPKNLLLEHQEHPKWSVKILPLRLPFEPELHAEAQTKLPKATALDGLQILRALQLPTLELEQRLLQSLALYPNLQSCFREKWSLETSHPSTVFTQ
jgi:tetratricopeptide (TPR) repeat protein